MFSNSRIAQVLFLFILSYSLAFAKDKIDSISINHYLTLQNIEIPLPVFYDNDNAVTNTLKFKYADIDEWLPEAGAGILWNGMNLQWEESSAAGGKLIILKKMKPNFIPISYSAFYVKTNRWIKAKLNLESSQLFEVFVDGQSLMTQETSSNDKEKMNSKEKEVKLEAGNHLVIIKSAADPKSKNDWIVKTSLKVNEKFAGNISINLKPEVVADVKELLDNPKVVNISISPDGKTAAISFSKHDKNNMGVESWIELRNVKDGKIIRSFRGMNKIHSVDWAPAGNKYAFTTFDDKKGTLWISDLSSGKTIPLVSGIENLGGFEWSPDASFIIYSVTEKNEAKNNDLKKYNIPQDRWPTSRYRSYLYKVDIAGGIKQKITAGKLTTNLNSISPDNNFIIFTRTAYNFKERPYSKTEYYLLDLSSMKVDSLMSLNWGGGAVWSPDGKKLLITGGPSSFGKIGIDLPADVIPNDFDTQGYIYDIDSKKVDAFTRKFDPQINVVYWLKNDNMIYLVTTDKSFEHLYRYDPGTRNFSYIELGSEYLSRISFAENNSTAVFLASSSNKMEKAYTLDLKSMEVKLLADPDTAVTSQINLGDVKDWNFTSSQGKEIFGRVYYPPNFDPIKKYPAIVYYYAGTVPVTREFEGRYPKNIWAANGYIVYVLQPSGATGFGQSFSAVHVNDWGKVTAQEIIEGTEKFIKSHPFIDPDRLGCIGASYGGFETLNLITKTDKFAAAIAHAGISDITNYWGVGFWGFLYSSVATANSFPWNRKDIYIDDSPIYNADKINTPLLLLHGSADTNVPPGESYKMYTALKLLGKDVEMITITGLDHHIMQYDKRKKWTKTIIAYFDKYLKDQPEWWNDMFNE